MVRRPNAVARVSRVLAEQYWYPDYKYSISTDLLSKVQNGLGTRDTRAPAFAGGVFIKVILKS
jgi:hypothetical protein